MRQFRYSLIATVTLSLLALAGCGDTAKSSSSVSAADTASNTTETKPAAPKPAPVTPQSCLKKFDFNNVEDRGSDTWRGTNGDITLIVKKQGSSSEAKRAVKDADLIVSASGGEYFVTGPMKSSSSRIDQTSVDAVANCLAGAK